MRVGPSGPWFETPRTRLRNWGYAEGRAAPHHEAERDRMCTKLILVCLPSRDFIALVFHYKTVMSNARALRPSCRMVERCIQVAFSSTRLLVNPTPAESNAVSSMWANRQPHIVGNSRRIPQDNSNDPPSPAFRSGVACAQCRPGSCTNRSAGTTGCASRCCSCQARDPSGCGADREEDQSEYGHGHRAG